MLKSKNIVYPAVLMLMILVPLARYYISTPWNNDCMTEYVKNMQASNYDWFIYNIDWAYHIEPANSRSVESLKKHKVWEANWCIMNSWNLFSDFNNTIYCGLTYTINNSPFFYEVKEPLALVEWEMINIFKS